MTSVESSIPERAPFRRSCIIFNFSGIRPSLSIFRVNVDNRNKEEVYALLDRMTQEGLAKVENLKVYFAPVTATTEPSHGVKNFCFSRQDFARMETEFYQYAEKLGLATVPYPAPNLSGCVATLPEGFVVEPDGTLQKCWNTVGQPEFAVGNILEYEAERWLQNPGYQRWMDWSPFSRELACSKCTWLPVCMGGCPLKVVYPEVMPDGKLELECTTFKWNWKKTFALLAQRADGEALGPAKPCTS